jgi:hypothetical protein
MEARITDLPLKIEDITVPGIVAGHFQLVF